MTDVNPIISVMTLNVNGLNTPIEGQKSNYMLPIRDTLCI